MNQKMLKSWCPSCPQFLGSLLCKGQTNTGFFSARKRKLTAANLMKFSSLPSSLGITQGGGERGVITCRLCHTLCGTFIICFYKRFEPSFISVKPIWIQKPTLKI